MRSTLISGRLIALGATAAFALALVAPGAWSTALAQTGGTPTPSPTAEPTQVFVAPAASATVAPTNSIIALTIPAGTFNQNTNVSFQPVLALSNDPTSSDSQNQVEATFAALGVPLPDDVSSGDSFVADVFELDATTVTGGAIGPDGFAEPLVMTIDLTPEVLAAAGGNGASVSLQFFDEATGLWTPVSCSVSGTSLTCELPHLSLWALVVNTTQADQVGAPAPAATGMESAGNSRTMLPYFLGAVAAAAALGGLGLRMARRRV